MNFDRFQPGAAEQEGEEPERPTLREWAEDPANDLAAERFVATFVADDGVELVLDLIGGGSGAAHVRLLERHFERWWDAGRPALPNHPKLLVSPWLPEAERQARAHLDAALPPGAAYSVYTRRRKRAGGTSEELGWFCTIEDGPATSGGRGDSPLAAARAALEAWRAYVAGPDVGRGGIEEATAGEAAGLAGEADAEAGDAAKPPRLDAPSAPSRAATGGAQADRKVS